MLSEIDHIVVRYFCRFNVAVFAVFMMVVMNGFFVGSADAQQRVGNIVINEASGMTSIHFNVNQQVPVEVFALTEPERLVIDFIGLKDTLPHWGSVVPKGAIQSVHSGMFKPGVTRWVITMKQKGSPWTHAWQNQGNKASLVVQIPDASATKAAVVTPPSIQKNVPLEPRGQNKPSPDQTSGIKSAPNPKKRIVVLDAGHGGNDPGARSVHGYYEKDLTLTMVKELKIVLEKTGRYKVHLTRSNDTYIKLRERMKKARSVKADLFISIHADAIPNKPTTSGFSVYTLSETASDKEAEALASQENKSDIIAEVDLSRENEVVTSILINLAQRETMNQSAEFANLLVAEAAKVTPLLQKTHRFAGFAVLKAADMPSVLVELGYLTNAIDAKNLIQKKHRQKLAQAFLKAIDAYFVDHP